MISNKELIKYADSIYIDENNFIRFITGRLKNEYNETCIIGNLYEKFIGPIPNLGAIRGDLLEHAIGKLSRVSNIKRKKFEKLVKINDAEDHDIKRVKKLKKKLLKIAK
jgi:hypothetical protein